MNNEMVSQYVRVEEFLNDLRVEYDMCLKTGVITDRFRVIAQDIIVKLKTLLDQAMGCFFEKHIQPKIPAGENVTKARVYFPIADDLHSLKSTLGRGLMSDLNQHFPLAYQFIESVQPYRNDANKWLVLLRDYSGERHMRLSPQKQIEETITIIKHDKTGSTVAVGSFAPDFTGTIFGATVDVKRQEVNSTPVGVSSRKDVLKNIVFEDSGHSVLLFCAEAYENSKKLIERFSQFI